MTAARLLRILLPQGCTIAQARPTHSAAVQPPSAPARLRLPPLFTTWLTPGPSILSRQMRPDSPLVLRLRTGRDPSRTPPFPDPLLSPSRVRARRVRLWQVACSPRTDKVR